MESHQKPPVNKTFKKIFDNEELEKQTIQDLENWEKEKQSKVKAAALRGVSKRNSLIAKPTNPKPEKVQPQKILKQERFI